MGIGAVYLIDTISWDRDIANQPNKMQKLDSADLGNLQTSTTSSAI